MFFNCGALLWCQYYCYLTWVIVIWSNAYSRVQQKANTSGTVKLLRIFTLCWWVKFVFDALFIFYLCLRVLECFTLQNTFIFFIFLIDLHLIPVPSMPSAECTFPFVRQPHCKPAVMKTLNYFIPCHFYTHCLSGQTAQ